MCCPRENVTHACWLRLGLPKGGSESHTRLPVRCLRLREVKYLCQGQKGAKLVCQHTLALAPKLAWVLAAPAGVVGCLRDDSDHMSPIEGAILLVVVVGVPIWLMLTTRAPVLPARDW